MKSKRMNPFRLVMSSFLLLGLVSLAHADNGVLPAGSHVCSQEIKSTYVGFYETGSHLEWTVLMSSTQNGPATLIYDQVLQAGEIVSVIKPPTPGTYFFRVCATNNNAGPVPYAYWVSSAGLFVGASAAELGPTGFVCSQVSPYGGAAAQRIGQSNVPVLWYVEEFDGDGNDLFERLRRYDDAGCMNGNVAGASFKPPRQIDQIAHLRTCIHGFAEFRYLLDGLSNAHISAANRRWNHF